MLVICTVSIRFLYSFDGAVRSCPEQRGVGQPGGCAWSPGSCALYAVNAQSCQNLKQGIQVGELDVASGCSRPCSALRCQCLRLSACTGGLLAGPTGRALPAAEQEGSAAFLGDTSATRQKRRRTFSTEVVNIKTAAKLRKENANIVPAADKLGCSGSARGRKPKLNRKYFDFFANKNIF